MTVNTDPDFVLDLYESNKRMRRNRENDARLLESALYALSKGKLEVVQDHVERVLESLRKSA